MNNVFFIPLAISLLAVLATLVAGLIVMTRGGEINKKYGNKLMRLRIACQAIALIFFALALMNNG